MIPGDAPMSEREFRAIINRQYRLPTQLELARERLAELRSERDWVAFDADDRPIRSRRYCRLPAMVLNLERKIAAFENEARRLGMPELLPPAAHPEPGRRAETA